MASRESVLQRMLVCQNIMDVAYRLEESSRAEISNIDYCVERLGHLMFAQVPAIDVLLGRLADERESALQRIFSYEDLELTQYYEDEALKRELSNIDYHINNLEHVLWTPPPLPSPEIVRPAFFVRGVLMY